MYTQLILLSSIYMYTNCIVTFPMDMIKTRLQIQGQDTGILNKSVMSQDTVAKSPVLKTARYRGVIRTGIGIGKNFKSYYIDWLIRTCVDITSHVCDRYRTVLE